MKVSNQSCSADAQDEVLDELFKFLKKNHSHNHALQLISLKSSILPFTTKKEKIRSLLIDAANTQSRPKMDTLEPFWSKTAEEKEDTFSSAKKFAEFLKKEACSKETPAGLLEGMFFSLYMIPGFGEKTAALFIKNLIYLHHKEIGYQERRFKIWSDRGLQCDNGDRIYIPVDSVIKHIFEGTNVGSNFKKINKSIHDFMAAKEYPIIDMVYWDDLWYWGFFTQHGNTENRTTVLNRSKFMTWKNSSPESYKQVEAPANEFIKIVKKLKKICRRS